MQLQPTGEMLTLIGGLLVAYFVYVLIARRNDKPSTDSPAMAHAALREIVERAVEEARKLPGLNTSEDGEQPREGRAIADHSYEDLLATAILNKVIERLQQERVDGNSNVLHITEPSKTKYTSTESERGIGEDVRSYECNGDRDASIRQNGDHREPVSFMMEERIEEVTTITSDDEPADNDVLEYGCTRRVPFPEFGMDIVDPPRELSPSSDSSSSDRNESFSRVKTRFRTEHTMDLVSPIESWEDNWLFQKKRSARSQPDAVAMLVPSSNTCYKALIGDRDAEDTTDLSECSSTRSDEEFEKELMETVDNITPRSPRTSECDVENQVPNDVMQLGEDEVDYVCRGNTKVEGIAAEKVAEDEDDKKRPSESSPALITGTKEEESKTKEKPSAKDTAGHGDRTIATAVESPVQKNAKAQLEKSSERNDRGNVADESEEQRESEYTEHYDTAIQRHLDSLTKVDACSGESEPAEETRELTVGQPERPEDNAAEEEKSERSEAKVQLIYGTRKSHADAIAEEDRLSGPPRPGTIAEREHKKWENAPPIENNPYSEENIRKRSWERRYSRKSADVPGVHYEIKKLNEVNLDVLLTNDPPDIKRFGRDYYINQSKAASGERSEWARSAMSSSSRPSSSLSQRSSCTGDEQRERQNEVMSEEADDMSVPQEEDTRTTSTWRRNNAEMIETTNNLSANPSDGTGQERRADDILEDQRKNSKNEINARLNNQEHSLEAERQDEKKRKVRRIDLKAYGFENEFSMASTARPQQQRVVNRLDLRSFGYQDGLRRARSNNQLDQPADNEKSNLTRCVMDCEKRRAEYKGFPVDHRDLTKSSGELNRLREDVVKVGSLVSAKSMPNVADDAYYYANPVRVSSNNNNNGDNDDNNENDDEKEKFTAKDERDPINADGSLNGDDEAPSDLDRSFEDIYIENKDRLRGSNGKLPMPSVKRLAEAFGGKQASVTEWVPAKASKTLVTKVDDVKDRSFTPEVQIVETPKQMHSLTARSLSKEFREGLRQMPNKITSPPVSRSLIDERAANRTEIVRSKREDSDIAVISPGKLKSNIKFWEQMQNRN